MPDQDSAPNYDQLELSAAIAAGSLRDFLDEAFHAFDEADWKTFVHDAAAAHNAGAIDILAALVALPDGRVGYAPQIFIEQIIPLLATDVPPLIALYDALTGRSDNEGVGYYLCTGVAGWCEADTSRPMTLATAARMGTVSVALLRVALIAGLKADRRQFLPLAIDMVAHGSTDESTTAIDVVGRFDAFVPAELRSVIAALDAALTAADRHIVLSALRSLVIIAKRSPANGPVGVRAIVSVTPVIEADARETIATELMFGAAKLDPVFADAAYEALSGTAAGETATINAIDQIIAHDLKGSRSTAAQTLLDGLLGRRVATMKNLDSSTHALLTGDPAVRMDVVARWLQSEKAALFLAVRDICSGFGEDALQFDLNFSSATRLEAERMARRCCALLMIYPETIASILASLLRTGPAAAFPVIERLLFDPLLINYWQGPRTYLEAAAADAPAPMAAILDRVFSRHDSYKAGIEAVRDLPELRPSQHHRFLVATKKRDEQREIGKAAQRKSIFSEIFPTSILLYGDSAIFDYHPEPGKTERQESQMQTHEFSHELPRADVIDPFGSWYQREQLLRGESDE